ncbi:MAG: prepilin-type N-terminal cleavage/methylation domain-containing protein [Thiotrichales bacterium]|nr:MAG: prepilin-type N-terminal cleavage/methylation domain-containing protein [Thiotrichales bacterium]
MQNFKAIKSTSGYTLVELMITAAVIAMLAAIAIPSYNGYIDTSKHAAAMTNAELLATFVDNYYYENGSYLAGTYDPAGDTVTLPNAYGWRPDGDKDQYRYNIAACGGGTINDCYTITVTYLQDASITESITKLPAP